MRSYNGHNSRIYNSRSIVSQQRATRVHTTSMLQYSIYTFCKLTVPIVLLDNKDKYNVTRQSVVTIVVSADSTTQT